MKNSVNTTGRRLRVHVPFMSVNAIRSRARANLGDQVSDDSHGDSLMQEVLTRTEPSAGAAPSRLLSPSSMQLPTTSDWRPASEPCSASRSAN